MEWSGFSCNVIALEVALAVQDELNFVEVHVFHGEMEVCNVAGDELDLGEVEVSTVRWELAM